MIKTGRLYKANYEATAPVVINQGGTSSGKTYAILQVLFTIGGQAPNQVITVVGQDIPNLKAGALRDALDIYRTSEELSALIASYNKSDRIFEYHNGTIIEFKSYDDAQDAKSGKRDYLFINEANGIPKPIYDELFLRTRIRTFIDYNPNARFWAHELHHKPGVQLIISDHRQNPFLPQQMRDNIEALRQDDPELWKVYARGKTGKIRGVIFSKWQTCQAIPDGATFIGRGLDFGFTNDPTAVVDVYRQDGQLWLEEILYETGLTNSDIHKRLHARDTGRARRLTIADSAEPKSIEELRRLGLLIEGAAKGPDSVNASIDVLKRYTLNVTQASTRLRKELENYKWKVDRITGESLNVPIDAFSHAIDAIRYVALNRLQRGPGGSTNWG